MKTTLPNLINMHYNLVSKINAQPSLRHILVFLSAIY